MYQTEGSTPTILRWVLLAATNFSILRGYTILAGINFSYLELCVIAIFN